MKIYLLFNILEQNILRFCKLFINRDLLLFYSFIYQFINSSDYLVHFIRK